MACPSPLLILSLFLFSLNQVSYAETDTLKPGQQLHDWQQLVSEGEVFRLGFFNPNPKSSVDIGVSGPRYIGIWFNNTPFYSVWVANRENPVPDSSGTLTVDTHGKLQITYQDGSPIVINPGQAVTKRTSRGNFTATLLDSGNLVLRQVYPDGMTGPVLWQSFDYPHNTLLPGMKLGMNLRTGQNWTLTSWMSEKLPSPGPFQLGLDPSGTNQLLVWRRGEVYWSSGVLQTNGSFKSAPLLTWMTGDIAEFKFVTKGEERYFTYLIKYKSVFSSLDLDTLGQLTLVVADRRGSNNRLTYDNASPCNYDAKNSTAICLTEKPVPCRKGSEFFQPKRGYMVRYEYYYYDSDINLSLSDCHRQCWKNCSCVAYQSFTSNDTGCQFWRKGSEFTPSDNSEFLYLLLNHGSSEGKKDHKLSF